MQKIGLVRFRSAMSASSSKLLKAEENAFLKDIDPEKEYLFTRPGKTYPTVFFIQTGGSEIYFKDVYENYEAPYLLLVSGSRNSLAASLEILSFLHRQGKQGYILQGEPADIKKQLDLYVRFYEAKKKLGKTRLGIIGKPSDWLIASNVDKKEARKRFGIELISIPNKEFLEKVDKRILSETGAYKRFLAKTSRKEDLRQSLYVHGALKTLCENYRLDGFTLRCFDLVNKRQQTSCLAFGLLNDDGITAGCEGDVATMITMHIMHLLFDTPSFMANPARIDVASKEAIFAHCTCPFSMTKSFTLATHFESGLGFGIRGQMKEEEITAVKISPDLKHVRLLSGRIKRNLFEKNLCRTQIEVAFDEDIDCLLSDPYGNHMVFLYGNRVEEIGRFFSYIGF